MRFNPKEHSVFVCGCARNVAPQLPGVLRNFERIGALFGEARYGIVENDSSDNTKEVVAAWCAENPERRSHLDLTGLCLTHKSRTDRLPVCRNALVDEMWKNPPTFMVMMDMDGICEDPIPEASILSCFEEQPDDWAVMTANISSQTYDVWAERSSEVPYDCWKMVWNRPAGMSDKDAVEKYVERHKRHIPKDRPLFEVISAFGGLGVYRTKYLTGCRHSKVSSYGTEDVEHCAFNEAIRSNGGKVFINPKLIIR